MEGGYFAVVLFMARLGPAIRHMDDNGVVEYLFFHCGGGGGSLDCEFYLYTWRL